MRGVKLAGFQAPGETGFAKGAIVAYSQEEITNIVRDVDRQPHIRKVKTIAQPDQRKSHDMMAHKLFIIPAPFFQPETEDDGLLSPVAGLQQIIRLEQRLMGSIRKGFVHAGSVEIPDGGSVHDIQAIGTKGTEIDGGIHLLHEAVLLRAGAKFEPARKRPEDALHGEFAGEGEDDDVESHETKVFGAFAIVKGRSRIGADGGGD